MPDPVKRRLGVLLFPGFETLDAFGPIEMLGNFGEQLEVTIVAENAGPVRAWQGWEAQATYGLDDCPPLDLLLVPGGFGTRTEVENTRLIDWIRARSEQAELVMTVCTGAGLLAKTGLLDGRRATTNKWVFAETAGHGPRTDWVKQARWVEDGKFFTSSGVSAGMDMALAAVARLFGAPVAERVATGTEYEWHRDATWDPFAKVHGLVE